MNFATRPYFLAFLGAVLCLVIRLGFIYETAATPPLSHPLPGMDVQLGWEAARTLRMDPVPAEAIELKIASAPLYPHWLALQQTVLGEDFHTHRIATAVFASLRAFLLFLIVFRLTRSRWIALAVAGLHAGLVSLIYFDTTPLKASTDLNLLVLLIFALTCWQRCEQPARALARGLVCGALLTAIFLSQLGTVFYALAVLIWIYFQAEWKPRLRVIFAASAIIVFGSSFLLFQNRHRFTPDDELRYVPRTGVDLRVAYNENSTGFYTLLPDIPGSPYGHALFSRVSARTATGRPVTFAEADRFHTATAVDYVRGHPLHALQLVARKAGYFVNNFEIQGVDYLYFIDDYSFLLRLTPIRFGLLFILGGLGMLALWRRRDRSIALLGPLFLCVLVTNCIGFVTWRFRLPAALILLCLSGPGLRYALDAVSEGLRPTPWRARARALGPLALAVAILATLTYRPALAFLDARNQPLARSRAEGAVLAQSRSAQATKPLTENLTLDDAQAICANQLLSKCRRAVAMLVDRGSRDVWANATHLSFLIALGHEAEAKMALFALSRQHWRLSQTVLTQIEGAAQPLAKRLLAEAEAEARATAQ